MRKVVVLVLLVTCLFLVSGADGCVSVSKRDGGQVQTTESQGKQPEPVRQGVVVEFLKDMPPDEIEGNFQVGLNFKNYLPEEKIFRGKVSDTLKDSFDGIPSNEEFEVVIPEAQFDGNRYYASEIKRFILPEFGGSYVYTGVEKGMETSIRVDLETDYSVYLAPYFCVKQEEVELSDCAASETWTGKRLLGVEEGEVSQTIYSPVSIESIEKSVKLFSGEETVVVKLVLSFKNLEDGFVVSPDANRPNLIQNLEVAGLTSGLFDCGVKGKRGIVGDFELVNGEAVIVCEKTFDLYDGAVQDALEITYEYTYLLRRSVNSIKLVPIYGEIT